ncbi:MAG: NADH-quinone oxidoreductase subunit J [Bdellovibrionaceae bacterium]|nr:NADH-quinone oxidoreductase subunit J [Pseudobdellovibrionaceae bacterium]
MTPDVFLFWFLALLIVGSGLAVLLFTNPVYSALSLAMTMVGVAAIFITLNAYFIAGVQLIVYAGAVMVLFVMVIMLFDIKSEVQAFTSGKISGAMKLIAVGLLSGLIVGGIIMGQKSFVGELSKDAAAQVAEANSAKMKRAAGADAATKELGVALFTKHIFGFEALGVLLTAIAVGTVALARSRGGTHAK